MLKKLAVSGVPSVDIESLKCKLFVFIYMCRMHSPDCAVQSRFRSVVLTLF